MADRYDHADRETLLRWCRIRGKPNWADFDTPTIRRLLRDDDRDIEELARWDPSD